MSLPLRHPLENVSSLDRVFEDLLVRFVINCPPEDLSSVERELFHFEEASWFYTDFVKLMNPTLPSFKIKSFAKNIIRLCPLVWKWDIQADEALQKFSQYKKSIPVRGAAIFNEKLNKILLVKGTESDSWSFPRGKISKDEDDVACCIREVKEEIGFDLTDYIDENQFIERNIQGKNYKIFIVSGVSEDYNFKPQVRNEIEKIEWRDFKKIQKTVHKPNVRYYLINSMMRPLSMWLRRQKHIVGDDQLKQYAEDQLKLLLGITKEEQVDPGRELLNMLHSAVHQSEDTEEVPKEFSSSAAQPLSMAAAATAAAAPMVNQMMLPQMVPPAVMGFTPFAPFPFMNGNIPFMGPQSLPGMPPLDHRQGINGPPPGSVSLGDPSNVMPTPDVSSLSRPAFAAQHPSDQRSQSSSKQLLALLNSKKGDEKDEATHANAKEDHARQCASSDLLNILKNPQSKAEPLVSHNGGTEDEFQEQDQSDGYEDFESGSEAGFHDEKQEEDRQDTDGYEDFENFADKVNAAKRSDFVDTPALLTPHPVAQEAQKQTNIRDTVRNTPIESSPTPSEMPKPKPKIKLLKRGERLADVLPKQSSPSSPTGKSPSSEDLLNLLKKPYNSNKPHHSPQLSPAQPHQNVEHHPQEQEKPILHASQQDMSPRISRQASPEEELMRMLKKGKDTQNLYEDGSFTPNDSQELLGVLRNPLIKSSVAPSTAEFSTSSGAPLSEKAIPPTPQAVSTELLDILKNPLKDNSPKPSQMSYSFVGNPFKKEPAYGNNASNELLGILHRK
ncbi:related to DCP2-Suppressor protein of a yeast pet mutant [Zygosaccharomyces bailii ISA1307]|nr:related to DCP2-Suppressor protein of a yeast pet mutant [Zygosaccharomyces bailii ISA1307]